jgi:hypothetical protein
MVQGAEYVIERKLIVDEKGDDVTGGQSTRHRIRAVGPGEAIHALAESVRGVILGTVKPRGHGAAAIMELDRKVYRLIAVPVPDRV